MSARGGFSPISTRLVAELGFLTITTKEIATPSGDSIERIVIEHPGAAAVVPIVDGDVILVEQYRAPVNGVMLEIPAGKLDDASATIEQTALRELEEETGWRAERLDHLADIMTSVGFCDERISIYLASGLSEGSRAPVGAEEEQLRILRMGLDDAIGAVLDGRITDSKTIVGLLLAARRVTA